MTTVMNETRTLEESYVKVPRAELVDILRARDGDTCRHPDCGRRMDFDIVDGPAEVTIDHWFPQYYGKSEGWTMAQIWDVDNLKLMHKKCNAKKGDLIPNADGTLPPKPQSTFRHRREKRADRSDFCVQCQNGHNLAMDEICASCGVSAQNYPRWAKVRTSECDHELLWCIWCSIGVIERPSSIGIAMRQADSTEIGEFQ
jgi:hypothetical protein